MNCCTNPSKCLLIALLLAGTAMILPAVAAPAAKPAQPPAPEVVTRSTFAMPANPKEGRDPFFPNSTRPYEIVSSAKAHTADISSLALKGISGPPDRRLAIINNHTFGVGDEENITTPQGPIHIRCLEIKTDSVVIECNGQRHELNYADNH